MDDAAFSGELDRWLRFHEGMLIDQVAPLATQALEAHDIAPGQFDHVLVDEYQDLTACEQELVERIWSRTGSLVVLGDDNQSIYSFRYNHPGGITEFAERWTHEAVLDIDLTENYRSASDIVDVANKMAASGGSKKAPMAPRHSSSGQTSRVHWQFLDDEIAGLAKYIESRSPEEFLVLVPLRLIGRKLEEAIGPDAKTSFTQELLEHKTVQERFTLATLFANPDDGVAMRHWLALKRDGHEYAPQWNAPAYSDIRNSGSKGLALVRAVAQGELVVKGQGSSHLVSRAKQLLALLDSKPQELEDQIKLLFDPKCADAESDAEKRRWAREDLIGLRNAAIKRIRDGADTDLRKVIDELRYHIATKLPLEAVETPRVVITTLHSAKGLEHDRVIIAGMADEILPGKSEDEEREERRRLLYVGVTRPRQELVVSWSHYMLYKDASRNQVRVDDVRMIGGQKWVVMGRTSLLPTDFPGELKTGGEWLRDSVGPF